MRWKQQIRRGVTASLDVYFEGRPASCLVSAFSPDEVEIVSGAAATVDGVNTTVASYDDDYPLTLTVADATGITVGDDYVLTSNGRAQSVSVVGLDGVTLDFSHELGPDVGVGDSLASTKVSYTFSSSALDDYDYGNNYRVVWVASGGTGVSEVETFFDLVRSPSYCAGSWAGFSRAHSDFASRMVDHTDQALSWDEKIEQAYVSMMYDLEAQILGGPEGSNDLSHAIIDWRQTERLVYLKLLAVQSKVLIPPDWGTYPQDYDAAVSNDYKVAMDSFASNIRYVDPAQERTGSAPKRLGGRTLQL